MTEKDLMAQPLAKATETIDGHAFTIVVPTGLDTDRSKTYVYWRSKSSFDLPTVSVIYSDMPMTPGEKGPGLSVPEEGQREIARNEALPEGGYLQLDQRKDHRYVELELCRPAAGGSMCCDVQQRVGAKDPPIADYPAVLVWAEKICRSLAPG